MLTLTRHEQPIDTMVILRARIKRTDPLFEHSPWAGREQYVRKTLRASELVETMLRWSKLGREIVSCVER